MKIYRPVKSNRLSQPFGDNSACIRLNPDGTAIRPYKVFGIQRNGTCPINSRPLYKELGMLGHSGEDWSTWHGEPLFFPVDCEEAGGWHSVEASDVDGGLGVDVISNNPVTIDGKKSYIKFRFWHLQKGSKDTDVQFGELIGFCDNTGASGGDHLHWGMKRCDKDGNGTEKNNGYYGAMDFSPWFENVFVLDVIQVKAQALSAIDLARKAIFNVQQFLKSYDKK